MDSASDVGIRHIIIIICACVRRIVMCSVNRDTKGALTGRDEYKTV